MHPPTDLDLTTHELPSLPMKCQTASSLLCTAIELVYALPAGVSRSATPCYYSANENSDFLDGSPLRKNSLKDVSLLPFDIFLP